MNEILLLGLSHKTAGVELREKLSCSSDEAVCLLDRLKSTNHIEEAYVLSTCNRFEIVTVCECIEKASVSIKSVISDFRNIPLPEFEDAFYTHSGDEAVKHIFRVGAGLDSLVLGEPQILGQIKEAYHLAVSRKSSGMILNRLFHRAFQTAKRIRTETGIGGSAVSVSYAAIELAKKIFGTLDGRNVLMLGAGEMAELAVAHLVRQKVGMVTVANRTLSRAVDLASRFEGKAASMDEIPLLLVNSDIIISSTGAPGFVIERDTVRSAMKKRGNRPVFFIDIAVPRDIDPEINRLVNAYVYDIDDLKGVIDENIETRSREAVRGERIVDEAAIKFRKWLDSLDIVPTIIALKEKSEEIVEAELARTLPNLKNLTEDEVEALKRMSQAIVGKIIHNPIKFLKMASHKGSESLYIGMTRLFFGLDDESSGNEDENAE
jgi:glutamyl-tRNA reductase